jgi:hypothetical protein
MGYLIGSTIKKITVTVPPADIATLDTIPFPLIPFNGNQYTILSAYMFTDASAIDSFGHMYLEFETSPKYAIYDETSGALTKVYKSYFITNMSHPPNIFGSRQVISGISATGLHLSSQLPPNNIFPATLFVTILYIDL